jgi:hypothetical protein
MSLGGLYNLSSACPALPAPPSSAKRTFISILQTNRKQYTHYMPDRSCIVRTPCSYSGAAFKSFSTRQEAEQHYNSLAGINTSAAAAAAAAGGMGGGSGLSGSKRSFDEVDMRRPPPAFTAGAVQPPPAAAAAGPSAAGRLPPQQQQQQAGLQVTVYFDGGSRGNPGRAGYGYAITDRETGERVSHSLC